MRKNNLIISFILTLLVGAQISHANEKVIIKAVGTWDTLTNYQKHEGPFWNELIYKQSKGQIIGEIKPQTAYGLQGFEIMRLVKNGVFDFAFGMPGYVAFENAIFEGADLSSLTQDIQTQREVADVYFPALEKAFEQIYNAKLLLLYPFPSQTLWCNKPITGIKDLDGMNIRVYSQTLSDFVEGVNGIPVTVPFSEVLPAMEKGLVDCGITGTMSAYKADWHAVATYAFTLRVGWGLAFGAMNLNKWNSLTPNQQSILKAELSNLEDRMWRETATEDDIAIACITGGECEIGNPGNMVRVEPSAEDLELRDKIATEVILANWAKRCGPECASIWNATVGNLLGLKAVNQD